MDPRLRAAVDASIGWYEDMCALHGVPTRITAGLWSALAAPPPLHSEVVVVEPTVTLAQVKGALGGRTPAGVKDSFALIDFAAAGMPLLFTADWLHRPGARTPTTWPGGWRVVDSLAQLDQWTGHHDTRGVLLPGILAQGHVKVLARYAGDDMVAGAVTRLGSGIVDISNWWQSRDAPLDWEELVSAVSCLWPERAQVGYARDGMRDAALRAGFSVVGPLRVFANAV
ncbi:MAG: hypothetical protein AVDCRST_MAG34-3120 [uncultured Nocardioidaceae bacterium]|uniref:Uncharacterized protein n=1 Tax=uncultured Nocardioidaceae bacterium TaxID=253824 RepID=A0A6J4MSE3_9ACTN|nr:MAG: hypothetical protein AVDCRST_MAG34-3120 [uncultured Nocardioidaceae bacterium]